MGKKSKNSEKTFNKDKLFELIYDTKGKKIPIYYDNKLNIDITILQLNSYPNLIYKILEFKIKNKIEDDDLVVVLFDSKKKNLLHN